MSAPFPPPLVAETGPDPETTERLMRELGEYVVGLRAIVGDALPAAAHVETAIILLHGCSADLLHALEACGGVRIREGAHAAEYVDLRGARVSVRAVERQERGKTRRAR